MTPTTADAADARAAAPADAASTSTVTPTTATAPTTADPTGTGATHSPAFAHIKKSAMSDIWSQPSDLNTAAKAFVPSVDPLKGGEFKVAIEQEYRSMQTMRTDIT